MQTKHLACRNDSQSNLLYLPVFLANLYGWHLGQFGSLISVCDTLNMCFPTYILMAEGCLCQCKWVVQGTDVFGKACCAMLCRATASLSSTSRAWYTHSTGFA